MLGFDDAEPIEDQFQEFEIDTTNYAEDPDANASAKRFLEEILSQAREDRVGLDELLKQQYNIWDCVTDVRWYSGRADIYLPAGHRAIERACAKQMARLFPAGSDTIDVHAMPPGDDKIESEAKVQEAVKALMWYDLHHIIKIKKLFPAGLRQLNTLGTMPFCLDYVTNEELDSQSARRTARLVKHPRLGLVGQPMPATEEAGPRGRFVDLHTFYIWPPTIERLEDAILIFEDQLVTESYLKAERDRGRFTFTDEQLKNSRGKFPTDSVWADSERMERVKTKTTDQSQLHVITWAYGMWAPPQELVGEQPDNGGAVNAEVAESAEVETGKSPRPFQFAMIGGDETVVLARQNPWWHQQAPHAVGKLYPWINEAYGRGLVYFIRKLQYQMNDTARQTFDAMTYSLNPIAAVDPALVPDPEALQYRPGAKWPIAPNNIRWLTIPPTHRNGFEAIRQLFEMIQEVAGSATGGQYLPTLGVARGAETATGQSLLVAQSDIDINLVVESIEDDVLQPILSMIDSTEQQFMNENTPRILRALGRKAIPLLQNGMEVRREQLEGARTYVWTGNTISNEREAFQKIGGEFLKIITQIEPDDMGKVNIWPFLKNFYRSFGFQDADNVFITRDIGGNVDPQLEHLVLTSGHPIPPKLGENYLLHLSAHDQALPQADIEGWGDKLKEHIAETLVIMRDDQVFMQQMMSQQQSALAPPGAEGGPPPPGAPGVPPGAPSPIPLGGGGPPPGSVQDARMAAVQRVGGRP